MALDEEGMKWFKEREELEARTRQTTRDAFDLAVSAGEHLLAGYKGDPLAGDVDHFPYKHTSSDVRQASPMFRQVARLSDQEKKHRPLAEAARVATWLGEELTQEIKMSAFGRALDDPDLPDDTIRRVLPRCLSADLDIDVLGWDQSELIDAMDGGALPEVPVIVGMRAAVDVFRQAYKRNHPGLRSTLY